ncbi:hypothetical protein BDZ97DRAFT_490322 [Flammula alnicola]|nr:hypothetical protein BDZ97DRAFT_490322 [Flammula alnicola]
MPTFIFLGSLNDTLARLPPRCHRVSVPLPDWIAPACNGLMYKLIHSHLFDSRLTFFPFPLLRRMVDGGIGISAVVAVGSKFIERSKFPGRHDAIYDKEVDKSIKLAERFDNIPREDVDHFEFEEYTMLRSKSLQDLRHYRDTQEEYKQKEWFRDPIEKYHSRGRVRQAKRRVQSSATQEGRHVDVSTARTYLCQLRRLKQESTFTVRI